VLQLERLAQQVGADFFPVAIGLSGPQIAASALEQARRGVYDALIVDTAGRLHIDSELMAEVQAIDAAVKPHQRLFVVDALSGQDALNSARAFSAALDLSGIILTKADGDARGGAALSVREVTGKPILFLGVGEKLAGLEVFSAERLAGRILGMGDVVGLVEKAREMAAAGDVAKAAPRRAKGEFTLDDFLEQLGQLKKMGPIEDLLKMMPGVNRAALEQSKPDLDRLRRYEAIMQSMTMKERRLPRVIDGSRRRRIAVGSGTSVSDVNRLLKDFDQARTMMKRLQRGPRGMAALRGLMR
jgi:signal recognition particle subunit SRP54